MLLAIDVGNTGTHFGAFEGDELVKHWRMATDPVATADELAVSFVTILGLDGIERGRIDGMIVSTVVPELAHEYEGLSERHLGAGECLTVGPQLKTGMAIRVENPHELGADRLVNAIAAYERTGGASITVDFGTSTNFDVVSAAGEYLGGVIAPGVEISLAALTARAAKLPRVDLSWPKTAIGRNTEAAIQAGFGYGFAGLVDGVIRRIAAELADKPHAIATGGLAATIAPLCETIDEVDDLLTLTGLRLIWELNTNG